MPYLTAAFAVFLSALAPAPALEASEPEVHCVVFVVGVDAKGAFETTEPDCFYSVSEASAWASLGLPLMSESLMSGDPIVAMSTFTLGTHYDGFNGTGSSISVVGSSCSGGYWNTSTSWDNRISSSYNGCARLRHYDFPNKGGQAENTYGAGTTDNLNSLNNRTESVSYHSS